MTFVPSPNCVRTFVHQYTQDDAKAQQPTRNGCKDIMDEMSHQLAALSPKNKERQTDESCVLSGDKSPPISIFVVRNALFHLLIHMGNLSSQFVFVDHIPHNHDAIGTNIRQMIALLMNLSRQLSINLYKSCMKKIQLNQRKYPVDLCKGKAGKYTEYSQHTGITKTVGQSTLDETNTESMSPNCEETSSSNTVCWTDTFVTQSISHIQQLTRQFAIDRDWLQFHTPRNLALALAGEIGELAEIFQFMGDDDSKDVTVLSVQQLDKIGQEMADVTIYICRLSDVIGIPLSNEIEKEV